MTPRYPSKKSKRDQDRTNEKKESVYLLSQLQEAYEFRKAKEYFLLCDKLNIDPSLPELYQQGEAELIMEKKVAEEEKKNIETLINPKQTYEMQKNKGNESLDETGFLFGNPAETSETQSKNTKEKKEINKSPYSNKITKKDLGKLEYLALERIFYGIHNIDLPHTLRENMNKDEILAKYYATGILKSRNAHLNKGKNDFEDLIKHLDKAAYTRIGYQLKKIQKNSEKRYSSKPGEQLERLDDMDETLKKRFVNSFYQVCNYSDREMPCIASFSDPNIDGKSKKLYIDPIHKFLNENKD